MRRRSLFTLLVAALAAGACGDDPLRPEDLVGSYLAEGDVGELTATNLRSGQSVDMLARGAFIRLTLDEDNSTEGRFFAPGADEDGGDFDADLRGAWELSGDTLRLRHSADTFLRDVRFRVRPDRLIAERTFVDDSVRVVLMRQ